MRRLRIFIPKGDPDSVEKLNPMVKPWAEELGFRPQEGEWAKRGKEFYERVEQIEDADICVCLHEWYEDGRFNGGDNSHTLGLIWEAKAAGKKVVVYFHTDSEESLGLEDVVLLRTSVRGAWQGDEEIFMPGPNGDLIEEVLGGNWEVKAKGAEAVVGFCGNLDNYAEQKRWWKRLMKQVGYTLVKRPRIEGALRKLGIYLTKHIGRRMRHQLIYLLQKSKDVRANFVIRGHCSSGQAEPAENEAIEQKRQMRRAFCQNVLGSDYTLCARGGGNYSYRFYETLCLGRIPLFVNTDCRLPFDDVVDWKKEVLWVEEKDIYSIGKRVKAFHDSLTPEEFKAKQRRCRELWEEYCSEFGYFSKLADVLRKRVCE